MPLIPSSPVWDSYVRHRRRRAAPAWVAYHLRAAVGRTSEIPDAVRCVSARAVEDMSGPIFDEVTAVRTRDGRQDTQPFIHGSLWSPGLDLGIDDMSGDDQFPWKLVADDWDTLSAWDIPWPDTDEVRIIQHMLTPELISCQNTVVVLTEQLADAIWAPPRMDTSDITAWLRLFRLPDTIASRRVLASYVVSNAVQAVAAIHDPTTSWVTHTIFESIMAETIRDTRRMAFFRQPATAILAAATLAEPAMVDGTTSRVTIDGDAAPRVTDRLTLDNSPIPIYRIASAIDRGTATDYVVKYLHSDVPSGLHYVMNDPDTPYRSRWLPRDGFSPSAIQRHAPLDVSLTASAAPHGALVGAGLSLTDG